MKKTIRIRIVFFKVTTWPDGANHFVICGVGQAFWPEKLRRAKKLAVCAIVVVIFWKKFKL